MSRPPAVYLFDTNIVVHLVRAREQGVRLKAMFGLGGVSAVGLISVVSVGETLSLAKQWGWGGVLFQRMHEFFATSHCIDISLPDILVAYADIDADCVSTGRRMGKNDLWLAATANYLNVPLLSTDADFDHLGGWLRVVRVDPESLK